jgi:hypothetical protein
LAAIRADVPAFLRAVSLETPGAEEALHVLSWVETDFAARAFPPQPAPSTEWSVAIQNVNARIQRLYDFSVYPFAFRLMSLLLGVGVIVAMIAPFIAAGFVHGLVSGSVHDWILAAEALVGIGWMVFFWVRLRKRVVHPWFQRITRPLYRRCYVRIARPELARFVLHTDLGLSTLQKEFAAIRRYARQLPVATFLEQDAGLGLLMCTRRFIG